MKSFLSLLLFSSLSFAGLLNAIAFTVDGEPITLYEIDRLAQQQHISKEQASIELFKQAVTKEVAASKNVFIDKELVKSYIDDIMSRSNLDRKTFEQNLRIEGLTYDEYFNQIYMQQLQQRLIAVLTHGEVSPPTEEEKLNFFNQNINDFSLPQSIEVIEYESTEKQALINIQRSPMFSPNNVTKRNKSIDPKIVNPKLAELLLSTKVKSYTQIIPLSATTFGMFYISSLGEIQSPQFSEVEVQVSKILSSKKNNQFINNFFQDKMRKANVKYIKIEPLTF